MTTRALAALAVVAGCSGAAGARDLRPTEPAQAIARWCHGLDLGLRARAGCGRALLAAGLDREDAGDVDGAIAHYRAVAAAALGEATALGPVDRRLVTDATAAEARFRAGRLAWDAGRAAEAGDLLWRLVRDLPDEPRAGDAVAWLVARVRSSEPRPLWRRLSALATALPGRAVTDNLLWALADLAEHELADPAAAQVLYDRLPLDHPRSGLRDDARWRGALLARARGDTAGALTRLQALLATREVALGTGSYFSIWLDDAQLLYATVLRDDVGDLAAAAAAFARLPRDYPRSILVDDALAAWAELAVTAGDRATACRVAARLLAHDPASRFAGRAGALAHHPDCPDTGHASAR